MKSRGLKRMDHKKAMRPALLPHRQTTANCQRGFMWVAASHGYWMPSASYWLFMEMLKRINNNECWGTLFFICLCAHVCVACGSRRPMLGAFLAASPHSGWDGVETGPLTEPGSHWLSFDSWPAAPGKLVSLSSSVWLQVHTSGFYRGSGLNSGPCACTASILQD